MTAQNLASSIIAQSERTPHSRVGQLGDTIAMADLVELAAGRARVLTANLPSGSAVAMVASNSTDYLVTWLACILSGHPVALMNPAYPPDFIVRVLAPLAPSAVLDEDFIVEARASGRMNPRELPGVETHGLATVSYMHTSGTTGLPKLCAQSNAYFLRLGRTYVDAFNLTSEDRVLAPLPLFHINPLGYGFVAAMLAGADAYTLGKFSASGFWPAVEQSRATVLVLHAPPVEILKRTAPTPMPVHSVRTMFFADPDFMRLFGIPQALSGYGSTEAGGISHLHHWSLDDSIPPEASRWGGTPRAGLDWRLDEEGIIHVRESVGGTIFSGYVTDSGLDTARDADGWFNTGDLGEDTAQHELVFLERAAESIRVKGEFVPITFVESRLATASGIEDCAIWKRKGDLVDDEIVLYAVGQHIEIEELRALVRDLPGFMRPAALAHVDALPRDEAVGKIRRRLMPDLPVARWTDLR